MTHGDKAKGKASKASGKKTSKGGASAKSRAVESSKARQVAKTVSKSSAAEKAGGNGKGKVRLTTDAVHFSNPLVAAAFRRAIKKYPNAFRRLTD